MEQGGKEAGKRHAKAASEEIASSGGEFEKAYRKALSGLDKQAKAIPIRFESNEARRDLADIRKEVETLKDAKIGVDISDKDAYKRLRDLSDAMDALHARAKNIEVRYDVDAARKGLHGLLNQIEKANPQLTLDLDTRGASRALGYFEKRLRKSAAQAADSLSDELTPEIAELRARLAGLGDVDITPDLNAGQVRAQVAEISAELSALARDVDVDFEVRADAGSAYRSMLAVNAEATALDGKHVEVTVGLDADEATRQMGAFEKALRKSATRAAENLDGSVSPQVEKIRGRLEAIGDIELTPELNTGQARAEVASLSRELRDLARQSPNVQVQTDTASAYRDLLAFNAAATALDKREVDVSVELDYEPDIIERSVTSLTNRLLNLGRQTDQTGNSMDIGANAFRSFNAVILAAAVLIPPLVPILGALGGALLSLLPILGAVGGGIGVMLAGFSGIGDAVGALADVESDAAKDRETSARRMRSAAQGVADAERSLRDARRNAAQGIADAERSLTDARRNAARANVAAERSVTDARRNAAQANAEAAQRVARARQAAARQVEDALKRQADAERNLADAQRDARDAQMDLLEARRLARQDIQDLENQVRQNALDERQAVIDLFNARVEFDATMGDGAATNLDKEQADIRHEQAKLRLKEIREEEARLAKEKKKIDREGVNGTDRVEAAQDALTAALERQRDAQRAVGEAAAEVRQARIDGARDVADAVRAQQQTEADGARSVADALRAQRETELAGVRSVSDAERSLQRTREDAARSVANAERSLKRAHEAQRQAYVDTAETGSASMEKLEEAMGKLGPAGRRFARFLFSLRGGFYELRNAIQAAMLPPIERAMRIIIGRYGPQFQDWATRMAEVVGGLFEQAAVRMATSPGWTRFFAMIDEYGPRLLQQFGETTLNWLETFAVLMTIAAPFAERLSEAMLRISENVRAFMNSTEGQEYWTDFLDYAARVGPMVADFFWTFVQAIINLGRALAPLGEMMLGALTNFLEFVANMDPKLLGAIATGIVGITIAFQLAVGAIAAIIAGGVAMGTLLSRVILIGGVVATVMLALYNNSEDFRNIIDALKDPVIFLAKAIGAIIVAMKIWKGLVALTAAIQGGLALATYGAAGATYAQGFAMKAAYVIGRIWHGVLLVVKLAQQGLLLATIRMNVAMAIMAARAKAVAIATKIWAAMQWLLNAAMKGNPLVRAAMLIGLLVGAIIWAYNNVEWFRDIVDAVFSFVADAAMWLWDAAKSAFGGLGDEVDAAGGILKKTGDIIMKVIGWIGDAFVWLWKKVVKPYLTFVVKFWVSVFQAMKGAWDKVLWPVLDLIFTAIAKLWTKIIWPYLKLVWNFWTTVFKGMKKVWEKVLWPTLKVIFEVIRYLWRKVVDPIFGWIGDKWDDVLTGMKIIWNKVLKPVFEAIIDFVLPRLKRAFSRTVNAIKDIWESLKGIIAKPVNFVINTILNDGLIAGFNKIAKFVGSEEIDKIKWNMNGNDPKRSGPDHLGGDVSRAAGGVLPGYTPGRDVHHFVSPTAGNLHLSGGEAIMRPEWTRAMGAGAINFLNSAARRGRAALSQAMGIVGGGQAFARGGVWHPGPRSQRAGHSKSLDEAWDINSPGGTGTPVRAFLKGVITRVADLGGSSYGKYIKMNHPEAGLQSLYAHLSAQLVRVGQRVARGQVIGREGNTGGSTGPHLHFELGGGQSAIDAFAGASASGVGRAAPGWLDKFINAPKAWFEGRIDGALDKIGAGRFGKTLKELPGKVIGKLADKAEGLVDKAGWLNPFGKAAEFGMKLGSKLAGGSGVSRWTPVVKAVLKSLGEPMHLTDDVLRRMNQESGGNPTIVNNWDSNAAAGYPSTGLMQVIRGTYQAYKPRPDQGPYLNGVSVNPFSNIYAGLNYARSRYGSIAYAMNKSGGYANGGIIDLADLGPLRTYGKSAGIDWGSKAGETTSTGAGSGIADNGTMMYDNGGYLPPGLTTVLNLTGKPEPVLTADQYAERMSGGDGFTYAPTFVASDLTAADVADDLNHEFRKIRRGGKHGRFH